MYSFRDTTATQASDSVKPSEALKINGVYIEDAVPGYRTLNVTGREAMTPEIDTFDTGIRDGSGIKYKRYPARIITVRYQIKAGSNEAFRDAFNKFAKALDVENAELIFNDEPDKYFTGTPSTIREVDAGKNAVVGEFEITCADPFKYSVEEYTAAPDADGVIAINYGGTVKAFPTLTASMNSDNGLVAFINDKEKVLQFGDAEETDGYEYTRNETLTTSSDYKTWSNDAKWTNDTGANPGGTNRNTAGTLYTPTVNGHTVLALSNPGTSTPKYWNGAQKSISIVDSNGTAGSTGIIAYMNSWFQTGAMGQTGMQEIAFVDDNDALICAQTIYKTDAVGNYAQVKFTVGNEVVKRFTFVPSDDPAQNPFIYNTGHSYMEKIGQNFKFHFNGSYYTYKYPQFKDTKVARVILYIGQSENRSGSKYVTRNYFRRVSIEIVGVDKWNDIPNKFPQYSSIEADCKNGKVYLDGIETPSLGALGNNWEEFFLVPGINQIKCLNSSWVTTAPTFGMKYREAFL